MCFCPKMHVTNLNYVVIIVHVCNFSPNFLRKKVAGDDNSLSRSVLKNISYYVVTRYLSMQKML
jgi:hypothetical protein